MRSVAPEVVDLRASVESVESVESVDTENVLLPLLERLGIDTSRISCGSAEVVDLAQESASDDGDGNDDEVVYIVDRLGCVVIDDGDDGDDGDDEDAWRIPSTSVSAGRTERTPATASRTVAAIAPSTDSTSTSTSTSASTPTYLHKTPLPARLALATSLYQKFNLLIFDGALPADLDISWNKRLTSTAGMTHYKRRIDARTSLPVYSCRIELATKVLDTAAKLERTLIHEMCHCAAWMIDHVAKPPHGAVFKKYAQRAMTVVPGVDVSTCHNYEIFYAYRWACGSCGVEYGRHSKSIDVEKKVCGGCGGRLAFLGRFRRGADGVVEVVAGRLGGGGGDCSPEKKMSGYSVFVKEHFHGMKLEMESEKASGGMGGTVLASEVMKRLAARWAREKRVGEREGNKSLAHSLL